MGYSSNKAILELYKAFKKRNTKALRRISNICAESVATENRKEMLSLSMISYVLGKILGKPRYIKDEKRGDLVDFVENKLNEALELSKTDDKEGIEKVCGEIMEYLEQFDIKKRHYVRGLFYKAKLKIASRMYAQGFSLSYVVSVTGSDTNEVLKYIGQTLMFDRVGRTKDVKERLKNVREIFQ